ncbi:MAG: V-type ATP synthase subunit A, partial [Clostridia bacterium]|nr:V-type ATP synthase subunit A [Clostridia bacterium]
VKVLGSSDTVGAISAIGAVSPPGGDLSEPVSQATLRIVKVFWGLSASLAYKRHFPAIDWLISYSLYADKMKDWYDERVGADFFTYRQFVMTVLQEEAALDEIVRLVGMDALSSKDRLTMETAKIIREDYLHQNAFDDIDTYSSMKKQFYMLKLIYEFDGRAREALENYADMNAILACPCKERIGRAKYIPEDNLSEFDEILKQMSAELKGLTGGEDV